MEIQQLQDIYGRHPMIRRLGKALARADVRSIRLSGLQGSAAPLFFASFALRCPQQLGAPYLFVMNDEEEAAYFYQDMVQLLGDEQVLYFPSSFKRAVKYGQRDSANVVLRTEVLSRLSGGALPLFVITSPQALSEQVIDSSSLQGHTLELSVGDARDIMDVQQSLLDMGFLRVDYVYEPGQFALRGSLLDVYSYSSELPYRIDFFGDEVDSIRT
ncbi:MAG: transcription-repair coupling factor, partial [Bacteroidaceae bacterium]|nr:transcription-repair coupling factor [Bacteroidaceae bacterium]